MKRQVYAIQKAGSLKRLRKESETLQAPGSNEVQVAVKAIGLNFADLFAILGLYSATPNGAFVPGLEYAGDVIAVGSAVEHLKVGDKVMGVTRFGAYATHLNIDADYVSLLPAGWNYTEGAGYLVQALTAYYGLFNLGNIREGMTVLIHSAAGGVGIQANRMAKRVGAYTIGTIGSEHKIKLLQEEGYDDYIVRKRNFAERLQEKLSGRKLNLVMECIGGKVFRAGYEALAPQGRVIIYGSAQYGSTQNTPNWPRLLWLYLRRPKVDPQRMIEMNKGVLGFNLIWLYHEKALMKKLLEEMKALQLPPPHIGHTFTFEQLPAALKLFQSGTTMGKVVIEVA